MKRRMIEMEQFARLLNQLYFTYSHSEKRNLLLRFFASTPDPERGIVLAAIAGDLPFPTFKRRLIKELIAERIDPVLFSLSYDYVGDLSETIALLWTAPNSEETALPTLSEMVATFNRLANHEIVPYLTELLDRADGPQRWALLKLGTGSMRIGVSARFLKQTLASFGKCDVQAIEQVWHALSPPYEPLFAWLEGKKEAPVLDDILFFHPVMLAHPIAEKELIKLSPDQFCIEPKYDGIRVQLLCSPQGKALYTRTGDEISASFPDLLVSINTAVVLDGELVIKTAEGIGSFNNLQQRLNRKKVTKSLLQKYPAAIILYDVLSIENEDLRVLNYIDRRERLERWFAIHPFDNMVLSELLPFSSSQQILKLREQILEEKSLAVEGLMLKRKDSPYIPGRPMGYWYKWKRDPLLIDAVLMYAQRGQGKRSSFYSDYTFGLWEGDLLLPIGKAYFGFTDQELHQLDKWVRYHTLQHFGPVREVEKEIVFEVAFDAVNWSSRHKSGVALRFPRIKRIRWDKPALEADTLETLKQVIKQTT